MSIHDKQDMDRTKWNPSAFVTNCGHQLPVEALVATYPDCADDLESVQKTVVNILYKLTYGHLIDKGGNT